MQERLDELTREWRVTVGRTFETGSPVAAYGRRGELPVVLKLIKKPGDEWATLLHPARP